MKITPKIRKRIIRYMRATGLSYGPAKKRVLDLMGKRGRRDG